jgi:ABC-2 type transport system permease protein
VGLDLRRLVRDRSALFFVLVLPFVLIITIGSFIAASGGKVSVAIIDDDGGTVARELVGALQDTSGVEVERGRDLREAERDIRIGQLSAALVIPEGFAEDVDRAGARVVVITDRTSRAAPLIEAALDDAIDKVGRRLTVEHVLEERGVEDAGAAAETAVGTSGRSTVEVQTLGSDSGSAGFAFAAGGQMILFMFINSLTAGGMFIEMRRLGILDRVRAGPVDSSDVLLGLGLSRFLVATGLATLILVFAAVAYGVEWGSPLVVGSTVVLFGLVSAGASILIGAYFDQPDASVSVGVPLGLGMAALGGCMFPLFLAPHAMQVAAKVLTPHAWAVEALYDSSATGAGLADLWVNLVVLAAWATTLILLARWATRRFSR